MRPTYLEVAMYILHDPGPGIISHYLQVYFSKI